MSIHDLLDEAQAAGLRVLAVDDRVVIRGPREADQLARLLLVRKLEVRAALAGAICCGQRSPGVHGEQLANACQLCPTSPTYWRTA